MNHSLLPEFLPEYHIAPSLLSPFPVRSEEIRAWGIIPRLGEKLSWGLYDMPSRRCTEYCDMQVTGRVQIHGIEGVEIAVTQHNSEDYYRTGRTEIIERRLAAQLTDTHCRILSESHVEDGVRKLFTFLDGDNFMNNWGSGPDNRGDEVLLSAKGILQRQGSVVTSQAGQESVDIVGRYTVTIGNKQYDTVCLMDAACFDDAIVSEQYLDKNGRTILWRRFNRDDWALDHFKKRWSELRPENERLIVNGQLYVHWYDFISDYIC